MTVLAAVDTATAQAAVKAAAPGDTIILEPGVYDSITLNAKTDLTITCDGRIVRPAKPTNHLFRIGTTRPCKNLAFDLAEVDGNNFAGGSAAGTVFRVQGCDGFTLRGRVHHTWNHAVHFAGAPVSNVDIDVELDNIGAGWTADPAFNPATPHGSGIYFATAAPVTNGRVKVTGRDFKGMAAVYAGGCDGLLVDLSGGIRRTGYRAVFCAGEGTVKGLRIPAPVVSECGDLYESSKALSDPLYGQGTNAIYLGGAPVTGGDCIITDPQITRCGENAIEGVHTLHGGAISETCYPYPNFGAGLAQSGLNPYSGSRVHGPKITNPGKYGVGIYSTNPVHDILVEDPDIEGAGICGVYAQQAGTGNTMTEVTIRRPKVRQGAAKPVNAVRLRAQGGGNSLGPSCTVESLTTVGSFTGPKVFLDAGTGSTNNAREVVAVTEPLSAKIAAYAVTPTMRKDFIARCAKDKITGAEGSRRAMAAWLADVPAPAPPVVVTRGAAPLGTLRWPTVGTVIKASPGNAAAAVKAHPGGTLELADGVYRETLFPVASRELTIQPAPGAVVWFDGGGTLTKAIEASGKVTVRGIGFRNYAPVNTTNGSNVMLYLGGTAAGSTIEHCILTGSTKAAIGGQVADVTLRNVTIEDCGYNGITFGSNSAKKGPDRFLLVDSIIRRINRGRYSGDGQIGALKITRSASPQIINTLVEDTNGAPGLWADVSCLTPVVARCEVKGAGIGVHLEQAVDGIVAGNTISGCNFGIAVLASIRTRIFGNTVTGASVACNLQQDRGQNPGNEQNRTNAESPWWTTETRVENNTLEAQTGHKIAFMAYADGPAKGMLDAPAMLAALRGNVFGGSVQLGKLDGSRPSLTPAQIAVLLGGKYAAEPQPVPVEIAALLK